MQKILNYLKDVFIKGLIFLIPILVILVLFGKVLGYLKGFSTKIAWLFGLKSLVGISGSTIISTIVFVAICVLAGYFVRLSFMESLRNWLDRKLGELLPGYETYRELALQKIKNEEEKLPYTKAVLLKENNYHVPGFLMDTLPDGRLTIFVPQAGNPKQGEIKIVATGEVTFLENTEVKKLLQAVQKLGAGMGSALADI